MRSTAMLRMFLVHAVHMAARLRVPTWADGPMARAGIALIRIYKMSLSAIVGRQCLFQPTCSTRALDHLRRNGWEGGMRLTSNQLMRCCGNYRISLSPSGTLEMETMDGLVFQEDEIGENLRDRYLSAMRAPFPTGQD